MTQPQKYSLDDDLQLATELADLADAISRDRFTAMDLVVTTKPDRTPVTDADQAVERAIRTALAERRPADGILGEEFGTEGTSVRQWIIDPIDGTAGFLRGIPIWGTLIALAVDGDPVVGMASSPALGKRWWARTGGGAWMTDERTPGADPVRLAVSGVAKLADASLSYNSIQQWDQTGHLDELITLSRQVWRTRAYGDMWSYMLLAEGLLDIVAEYDLQPYDLAALAPIVQEAGGRFSSADGRPGPWHGSALATNSLLHEPALRALGSATTTTDAPASPSAPTR
ncbi:histidinol phosphatase [Cryobacterium sp. TMT2-17-1]|uniref:inositol monophosphatase family protein n=1 Tax=unclassified Cryobacterium TaxID=2649013 RepID=UPI00106A1BA0|nr:MULTISPECIES: inositol monophosphatase family protein [unclassified Cryobacterium]TFC34970.1 histidinol phosphatase [Cryobacterium sp. TMT2-14]TFC51431.1 histidinol phosphatase [Cryobacterium sp. TMT2-17-1]TFC71635.1 histidinol phosphatase [Cryobacterium sp. TMT2-4]